MPRIALDKQMPAHLIERIKKCEDSDVGHYWQSVMHLDGCHTYTNIYECLTCKAHLTISGERQMTSRGKMQPGIYMANESECERCMELVGGARRKPTKRVIHV